MTTPFIERKLEEFDGRFPLPKFLALSGGKGVERDLMLMFLRTSLTEALLEGIKLAEGCVPEEKKSDWANSHWSEPEHGWNASRTETLSKIQLLKESVGV